MSWSLIVVGLLFLVWPLVYRLQIGRIHDKLAARGRDTTDFDRAMWRPAFRAVLWIAPIGGVALLIAGLTGQ